MRRLANRLLWGGLVWAVVVALACAQPQRSNPPSAPAGAGMSAPSATASGHSAPASPRTGRGAALDPPVTVRFGETPASFNAAIYVALARGYFREEGLDVALEAFDTSERQIPALAAGQTDAAAAGVSAGLFNGLARELPIRIVAGQGRIVPGMSPGSLLVRKALYDAGGVRDYADLQGLRIAVTSPTAGLSSDLYRALAAGSLTYADIDLKLLPFPDMNPALANDAIDVATQVEPFVSAAVRSGIAVRWKELAEVYPNHQLTMILYNTDFAHRQPEAAVRLLVAYLRGAREFMAAITGSGDKTPMYRILAEYTPIKDVSVYATLVPNYIHPDAELNVESLEADQALWASQGHIPRPVDLSQVIDLQYLQTALQRLDGPP